ncbi:gliding motility-associated C-terminal domain-containing protein/Por secretion system C-terminal sorting domain-containing protein [Algoriphagus boritolerans DSM 17298 = JCM 18970]|uniref:Gliding motility-associated C-terminal domain-containing protein/Por secretion system C-terminal sorting domain-containing protein n=2 Tax=Algoriphagus TaxID=246875 RepID=A0A1H5VCI2_9BACT|nr:gliding motility-associated C-terminal domain-containing protein/Por secretion system C-terminal sorting domain-containing protein [Algoriphagus boritolerans DSM 17298 = JCM 18970]
MSGAKILLLAISMMIHYSAWSQFAFNIPNREGQRVHNYQTIHVAVSGKLALCSHSEKGSINLDVTGGKPPYKFRWNTNETTQNRTNLNAGTYTVKITDAEGTEHIERIIVQPPFPLILNPVVKRDASCGSGNDGYAKISVKIGRNDYEEDSPPYKITWSNGLEDVWEVADLAPGTYIVTVADKYNCDVSLSFDIKAAAEGIKVTSTTQDPDCDSPNSGKIQLNVTGGEAPYSFIWSNGASSKDLTNLTAGDYQVLVKDNKGCSYQASFSLHAPESFQIDSKIVQPACLNSTDGIIEILPQGGQGPFTFLWSNGQTTSKATALAAGNYSVKVTDAIGCTVEHQVTLTNQSTLALAILENRPVSCSGKADGGVSIQVKGEYGKYKIKWSDGVEDLLQRKDLDAGDYTITATDESGCAAAVTVSVGETSKIQARIETALDVDCAAGETTGVAWVSIQGGKEPYTITWNTSSANSREITFTSSGILKATITDALGCTVETEAKVDFPNQNTQGSRLDFQYRKLVISSEPEVMVEEEILFESEIAPEFIAWEWEFGDGKKSAEKDPVHIFSKAGDYEVKLTGYDIFGCSMVESNRVQVTSPTELIAIPNAFTPNGDGLNDTFSPKVRAISSFQLEVFNTWGEKLFITNSLESKGWDGTYKGQLAPAGNYLYRITLKTLDGQLVNRTGGITLIR